MFDDHNEFRSRLEAALKAQGESLSAPEKKAIYKAVSWRDETAPPVIARRSKLKAGEHFEPGFDGVYLETVGKDRFMVEYAPQGQTPVVRVNNKRHGLSVISTVTNKGQMRWKAFDGALNSDILIDFLRRLVKDAGGKIYLILDNLRVHHSNPYRLQTRAVTCVSAVSPLRSHTCMQVCACTHDERA